MLFLPHSFVELIFCQAYGRWLVSLEDPLGQWRLQGDWLADSVEPLRLTAKADK